MISSVQFQPSPVSAVHPSGVYAYRSLVDLLHQSVKDYGVMPAFDCMGTSISFKQLDVLSLKFAAYLQQDLGLRKGNRIAIQLPNILQYPIAMLGALRAGLTVVNTNPIATTDEMKRQFTDSGAEAIVILSNVAHQLEEVLPDTAIHHVIVTELGDQLGFFKRIMVNGIFSNMKRRKARPYNIRNAVSFNTALKKGSKQVFQHVNISSHEAAFLKYPIEITATSRGAIVSHLDLLDSIDQLTDWLSVSLKNGGETMITGMPRLQEHTLPINYLTMMKMGARNVLIPNPLDARTLIKAMKKYRFSVISGINTLYNNIMRHPDFDKVNFKHLKFQVPVEWM